ncbi:MAG: cytochrome c biogenesis protein CcsA [Deltaproteobacteria bacterium]|nr:cytochrome c biogenesis protein CcsA [Deltaproteobacteria bacterium]
MAGGGPGAKLLGGAALVLLAVGLYVGLVLAPPDAVQGEVQRIMYLHLPFVLIAYLAFAIVFLAGIAYLWKRDEWADVLAHSAAEIGVVFTGLVLVTGSIWGKPTWGVWWTWDARLTTTLLLFFIFVGYLMVRALTEERGRGARYAAIVGIIGALDIPIIHMSVVWWRTLHQPSTFLRAQGPAIAPALMIPLFVNFGAFLVLFLFLLVRRMRLEQARREAEALEALT